MTAERPHNAAMAFEARIQGASDKYVANGYRVDEATLHKQRPDRLDPLSPGSFKGEPPPLDWLVEGCFLNRTVGQISGDGGLGKSLLMQQLCTASALGRPWLGLGTQQCKSLAIFCEDDSDELWRRQSKINKYYGCTPEDIADNILYAPRPGLENLMFEFLPRSRKPNIQELYQETRQTALSFGARIVILDTQADIYAGNENDRGQPTEVVTVLRRLAIEINGIVIITAHPSLAGMSSGSGRSGSTGWSNKVRSRVYLTSAGTAEDDMPTDERILKTMKNNHGPGGGKIRLLWQDGVFILADEARGPMGHVEKIDLDGRLVEALRKAILSGTMPAASPQAPNGFAALARKALGFASFKHTEIVNAQERLINSGRFVTKEMGPPAKRRVYLRTADTRLPGEPRE